MQQMSPEERQNQSYGHYEGNTTYQVHESASAGQKLNVDDDEQFAEVLARKIKAELKSEVQPRRDPSMGYRLALAIVSVCILVPLFVALVIALGLGLGAGGTGVALGWGFIVACAVIFAANAYFSWASIEISKHQGQK